MLVLEFKAYGKVFQFVAVDEAIRITQFIRNKSLRLWMNGKAKSWLERSRNCTFLAKEFDLANRLNSMATQASAERARAAITRF
jgi:putative transposase